MSVQLRNEMNAIRKEILDLSALVEQCFQKTIRAIKHRDAALAQEIIDGDREIDAIEIRVEEHCVKILTLYQPVATDLRLIISLLKIDNDLERIADLAADIAERVISWNKYPLKLQPFDLIGMAEKVQWMVRHSLDAMVHLDSKLASDVCVTDDQIDDMLEEAYTVITQAIKQTPDQVNSLLNQLSIASYLEQIADHAKKITEDIIYAANAEIVRHQKSISPHNPTE